MYRHIKRSDLSTCEKDFLGQQVFITSSFLWNHSAFYPIQEHRHDFHTKIKVDGQSLKNYWRAEYDQFLEESQVPVVSLLSSEFEDVFSPTLRKQLFTVSFMEDRNGVLKTHSTISKKARGLFDSCYGEIVKRLMLYENCLLMSLIIVRIYPLIMS